MVAMVRIGGVLHAGRTVHDVRQFGRARPDPVLLDSAHEPIWLCLVLRPIGHHTAAHALLLAPRARAATREGFASCWRAEGMTPSNKMHRSYLTFVWARADTAMDSWTQRLQTARH